MKHLNLYWLISFPFLFLVSQVAVSQCNDVPNDAQSSDELLHYLQLFEVSRCSSPESSWVPEVVLFRCGPDSENSSYYLGMIAKSKIYFFKGNNRIYSSWCRSDNFGQFYHDVMKESEWIIDGY